MKWSQLDSLYAWTERRKTQRFSIEAPAWLQWKGPDGKQRHCYGVTRNLSAEGVFVEAEVTPHLGSNVEAAVDLSRTKVANVNLSLEGKGVVVRLRPSESGPEGFAARIDFEIAKGTGHES
jgi:hypothetical protein